MNLKRLREELSSMRQQKTIKESKAQTSLNRAKEFLTLMEEILEK